MSLLFRVLHPRQNSEGHLPHQEVQFQRPPSAWSGLRRRPPPVGRMQLRPALQLPQELALHLHQAEQGLRMGAGVLQRHRKPTPRHAQEAGGEDNVAAAHSGNGGDEVGRVTRVQRSPLDWLGLIQLVGGWLCVAAAKLRKSAQRGILILKVVSAIIWSKTAEIR